jgi:5-methylcytosine-specific restriction endonuclease McrA
MKNNPNTNCWFTCQNNFCKILGKCRNRNSKLNKNKKQQVLQRDKKCLVCGTLENLTVDHIIPRSKGGTNHIENLQTLCNDCNHKKGDII